MQAKKRGASVVVMTHRDSAIEAVDLLLVLAAGNQVEFGGKEQVMRSLAEKHWPGNQNRPGKRGLLPRSLRHHFRCRVPARSQVRPA